MNAKKGLTPVELQKRLWLSYPVEPQLRAERFAAVCQFLMEGAPSAGPPTAGLSPQGLEAKRNVLPHLV